MKRFILPLALFPALLFGVNGTLQIGYGPKSHGMGGVGIALPQDSLAAAHNPAGLVLVGDRVDAGARWIGFDGGTTLTDPANTAQSGRFSSTENYLFPEIGLSWMICEDMSLGISVYLNSLFDVKYERQLPSGTPATRSEFHEYFITPAWSWLIGDCHMIGVAAHISWARARFAGTQGLLNPSSLFPGQFASAEGETSWGGGLRIGYLGHFFGCISVGLTYQSKIWRSAYEQYRGFLPSSGDLDSPGLLGAGVAICILPTLVVSGDIIRIFWSDTEFFGNASGSRNPYGAKQGPGLGWNDKFIFKGGVAYDVLECITLRMGYNYGPSPISTSEVKMNALTLATTQHHITLGSSYVWGPNEISISYVHAFRTSEHHSDGANGKQEIDNRQNAVSLSLAHCF